MHFTDRIEFSLTEHPFKHAFISKFDVVVDTVVDVVVGNGVGVGVLVGVGVCPLAGPSKKNPSTSKVSGALLFWEKRNDDWLRVLLRNAS